jgi:hypothetical protein
MVSGRLWAVLLTTSFAGCVSRPPTIAHVHIGHALTAVPSTPNHVGYLTQAERRAKEANDRAARAGASSDLAEIKRNVAAVVTATDSEDAFGVKQALALAANHISFAATSADASVNLRESAPVFASDVSRVFERCELIRLLGNDVARSTSSRETQVSVDEIRKLADANLSGDDADGDGSVGSQRAEYGLVQIRNALEGIVAREDPPYVTADQWYLLNLVRLPNGKWVFDRLRRSGSMEGYR